MFDSYNYGGHTLGPANLWALEKQNRKSTMVCFTFDDFEKYSIPYGIDLYIKLLEKTCNGFFKGLVRLENIVGNSAFEEFKVCAKATYIHLQSALNLAKFSKCKDIKNNGLKEIIDKEESITKQLIKISADNNKIGFEMSNHYFYTQNSLLEKLLNLHFIKQNLDYTN